MQEKILYNKNGNVIVLLEKNNTKWIEVEGSASLRLCPSYDYTLVVNSNVVWKNTLGEKLKIKIENDCLILEEETNLLLPFLNIPVDTLLSIKTPEKLNEYIKSQQEKKEKKEFEIMKKVYEIGTSGEIDNNWRYVENNKMKELFNRINNFDSPENKKFISSLIDPLITILISKNKMSDCLDKLEISAFELKSKLKKYPEVVTMLCLEYKIDINDLINYNVNDDMEKMQKM